MVWKFFNFKITTKDDLNLASMIEKNNISNTIKVGSGFDVHEFEEGHFIKLFGIKVPFNKGLKGIPMLTDFIH